MHITRVFSLIFTLAIAGTAQGASPCETEIHAQAAVERVPDYLAIIIAKVESGDTPNPNALNVGGRAFQFRSAASAKAVIDAAMAAGRPVDIGCMQINAQYHGDKVSNLHDLLDPATNVRVGMRYLRELYEKLGSWPAAAGAYHNQADHARNQAYRCRLARKLDPDISVPSCS